MLRKIFLLAFVFSVCGIPIKGRENSGYLWPLKEFRELSSGFGDYRSFHFHSGIDIPTEKKTGYEVSAPGSGWVYRVYTSWWGYGKAVYLKLDDGKLVQFGHLSDFSAKIREHVQQRQLESKSYFLDDYLDENRIRVQKGEVIGYSGESGTGAAHLHFELRDEKNQPLNPLTHGFALEDSTSPVMEEIAFRPLGINSFVNGKDEVIILPLISDSVTKSYTLADAPILSGRIGLELKACDKTGRRRLTIYKSSVYLDHELIFSCAYDTLNFKNTWMVELDRDFQLRRRGKGHFYKLYADPGNDLDLYSAAEPDRGVIDTGRYYSSSEKVWTPGANIIRILVEDASGNFSQAQFYVIFDRKPEISVDEIVKTGLGYEIRGKIIDDDRFSRIEIGTSAADRLRWVEKTLVNNTGENDFVWEEEVKGATIIRFRAVDELELKSDPHYLVLNSVTYQQNPAGGEVNLDLDHSFKDGFLIIGLEFDSVLRKKPQLSLKVGGFLFHPLLITQMDERSYQATYAFSEAKAKEVVLEVMCQNVWGDSATIVHRIPLSVCSPASGGEAWSEDGAARIKIDSGTVHCPVQLLIKKIARTKTSGKRGDIYSFEPDDVPFAKSAWVSLSYERTGGDPNRLALYEYKNRSWLFVGNELDPEAKVVSGRVRYLSTYALIEDESAPKVKIVRPRKERRIKNRQPEIYAKIWDDRSGFGSEKAIIVTIDDQWIIPEYDPEKGVLKTTPHRPLSYGWHTLRIVAEDRMGNVGVAERKFEITE